MGLGYGDEGSVAVLRTLTHLCCSSDFTRRRAKVYVYREVSHHPIETESSQTKRFRFVSFPRAGDQSIAQ